MEQSKDVKPSDRWKRHLEKTGHRLIDPDSYSGQFAVYSWFCEKCQNSYQRSYKTEKSKPECPKCSELRLGQRWTRESAAEALRGRGFELLGGFSNARSRIEIKDLETGTVYKTTLKWLLNGADPRKKSGDHLTKEEHLEFARSLRYEVLDLRVSKKEKTALKCLDCGETSEVKWVMWKASAKAAGTKRCKTCALRDRSRGPEDAVALLEAKGYRLVGRVEGKVKVKVKDKLDVFCPRGHQFKTRLQSRKGCPHCHKENRIRPPKGLLEDLKAQGYTWKDEYSGRRERVEMTCPKGHVWVPKWAYLATDNRCPGCAEEAVRETSRANARRAASALEAEGYQVTSDQELAEGKLFKVTWVCPKGHKGCTSVSGLSNGNRCERCAFVNTRWEKELTAWLVANEIRFEEKNRRLIKPLELDFILPDLGVAIELCGNFFHSERYKDRGYHLRKHNLAKEKGIRLISIFESDWMGPEIISNYLALPPHRVPVCRLSGNELGFTCPQSGNELGAAHLISSVFGYSFLRIDWKSASVRVEDLLESVPSEVPFFWVEDQRLHSIDPPSCLRLAYHQELPDVSYALKERPIRAVECKDSRKHYKLWGCGFKVYAKGGRSVWYPEPDLVGGVAVYTLEETEKGGEIVRETPRWLDSAIKSLGEKGMEVSVVFLEKTKTLSK